MKEWKKHCRNCGECCGPIPMPRVLYLANREHIQHLPDQVIAGGNEDMVVPIRDDLHCVFLTDDKKCAIYEQRPYICRLYGTIPELACFKVKTPATTTHRIPNKAPSIPTSPRTGPAPYHHANRQSKRLRMAAVSKTQWELY